jgi:hypothetical protein
LLGELSILLAGPAPPEAAQVGDDVFEKPERCLVEQRVARTRPMQLNELIHESDRIG